MLSLISLFSDFHCLPPLMYFAALFRYADALRRHFTPLFRCYDYLAAGSPLRFFIFMLPLLPPPLLLPFF